MHVNSQYSLAIHTLLIFAYYKDKKITSELVANSVGCSPVLVRKVFAKLKKAGLLDTKSGNGKTELSRPEEEITLWDIYSSTNETAHDKIFKMYEHNSATCPVGSNIKPLLMPYFENTVDAMKKYMQSVTLKDLANELKIKYIQK